MDCTRTLYQGITVIYSETEAEGRQASLSQLESHQYVRSTQTVHHSCQISSWTKTSLIRDNCTMFITTAHITPAVSTWHSIWKLLDLYGNNLYR